MTRSRPLPDRFDPACLALRWALALFDGLIAGGLRQVVLSPGSRSTPLVLAAQQRPVLALRPILDERSAAFYALGLARASGRPVALIATSGSAPAHWLPAVMEASASGIPLILLSADRPPELRGWGANQTVDQTRLFGVFAREFHDPGPPVEDPAAIKALGALGRRAARVSQEPRPGPVHLNLPLREPLVPRGDCPGLPAPSAPPADDQAAGERAPFWQPCTVHDDPSVWLRGRGLICCGPGCPPDLAPALWASAAALGLPVLADPLSGLRFGPAPAPRIARYDSLLRHAAAARALRPDWAIRLGRAPVSRILLDWLAGVPTLLIDPGGAWHDPNHDGVQQLTADPAAVLNWLREQDRLRQASDWLALWTAAEAHLDRLAAEFLAEAPWCEAQLLVELLEALPSGEALLCANSLPIRQLDTWSGGGAKPLRIFGNRGVSGIDGQLSTLAGANAGGLPTTGLLGDLSFLHDLSGLLLLPGLPRPCILINNGGGRIFDELPQSTLPEFERLWRTPQEIRPGLLMAAVGVAHRIVTDGDSFRQALAESLSTGTGAGVIEVRIDPRVSQQVHREFRARVSRQA